MGNTNSSPRYRSRSPDPALDHTWSNSYPKAERAGNNRVWQQQQQQLQQHNPYQPASSGAMVNGHHSTPYDQFEQECIQHQQQQQQTKMSDQQPLRFARWVNIENSNNKDP